MENGRAIVSLVWLEADLIKGRLSCQTIVSIISTFPAPGPSLEWKATEISSDGDLQINQFASGKTCNGVIILDI